MHDARHYQAQLRQELASRCERNPRYSLRAFARALDVDAGTLSRVLDGKQVPSLKLCQRLLKTLDLAPEQQQAFLASVADTHRSRTLQRLSPALRSFKSAARPQDLSIDHYRVIADWYHIALLELTYVRGFQPTPRWIARELGISITEAKLAIERLLQLGLLEKKDGTLVKTQAQLSTADKHITTAALKKHQKQLLEKAIHSLENDPIEERNVSSVMMAIDPRKLPLAKQLIREFNQSLCRLLEDGSQERVYNLEVALYPLQPPRDLPPKGKSK